MLAKALLISLIAACGLHTGANSDADPPDEIQPKPEKDQHFCCSDIDDKNKGEGCIAIGPEQINSCQNVLYCADSWKKKDGEVTCIHD